MRISSPVPRLGDEGIAWDKAFGVSNRQIDRGAQPWFLQPRVTDGEANRGFVLKGD
jgi:hypothetical protein